VSAYISSQLRDDAWTRFRGRCAYCLSPHQLLDAFFEVDHIIPISAGGVTEAANLALACPLCNRYKGSAIRAEDSLTRRIVPLFDPQRQQWHRHFAWSVDNLTIIGRTATGRATINVLRVNNDRIVSMRALWLRLGALPPLWLASIIE
jgi:hypothetical protein